METPRLPLPEWVRDLHIKLDRIADATDARVALAKAQAYIQRLREQRALLLTENQRLRLEVAELHDVIIGKLSKP